MCERDEFAIISVINRYAIAIDARRWDLFDTIFTDDVDLELPSGRYYNLASLKAEFERAHDRFDVTQHAMANHLVSIDGDTANTFTYCLWRLIGRESGRVDIFEGTAWYDDALVRTAPGWRIQKRTCRIVWSSGNQKVTGTSHNTAGTLLRREAAEDRIGYLHAFDEG